MGGGGGGGEGEGVNNLKRYVFGHCYVLYVDN